MTIYTTTGTQFSKAGITVSYTDASGAAATQNVTFANKTFSIDSGLNVTAGNVDFAGAAEIHGDAKLDSKLDVVGAARFQNALTVDGAFNMGGSLSMAGAADMGSTLAVTGATNLKNTLAVAGASNLNSTLAVAGASNLNSSLVVAGATNLNNSLAVSGATTLTGAATMNNTLHVNGAATLGAALTVTGAATLNNGVTVNGTSTHNGALVVGGAATVGGSLGVTGAATMSSSMTVKGASLLENTLGVDGAATLKSTLAVTGAATLGSSVAVAGAAAAGYNLTVTGKSKLKGDVALDSALVVASDATLQGKLDVTGAAKMASSLAVAGDAAAGYNLTVTGKSKLKGDVALDSALAVASDASLQGKLNVTGAAMMQSTLNVSGAANLNTSLAVAGPAADGCKLTVSGKTKLKDDVDISGSLVIGGSITANNNFTVNGNLTVIGTQTSLNTVNLDVADNAILVAKGNLTDDIQSGVMVQYKPSGAAEAKYAGVKRLPGTGEFVFYKDAAKPIEPNAAGGVVGEADTAGAVARALNLKNEAQASVVKLEAAEAAALTEKDWAAGKKADAASLFPAEPVRIISSPEVKGEWITINYGSTKQFSNIVVCDNGVSPTMGQSESFGQALAIFDVYYSDNNTNWTFAKTVDFITDYRNDGNIIFSSPLSFQYLRIVINKTRGYMDWSKNSALRYDIIFNRCRLLVDHNLTLANISVSSGLGIPNGTKLNSYPGAVNAITIERLNNDAGWNVLGNESTYNYGYRTYKGNNIAMPAAGTPEQEEAYNAAYAAWVLAKAPFVDTYNTAKAVYDAALATYNAKVAATAAARLQVTALQAPFAAAVAADTAYRAAAAEAAAAQAEVTAKANLKDAAAAVAAPFQASKNRTAAALTIATVAKNTAFDAIPAEPVSGGIVTPAVAGEWIQIDYGTPSLITKFNHDVTGGNCGLREVDFYGSNNSSDSFTFITNKTYTQEGGGRNCIFPNGGVTYRYLRLVIKSLSANANTHYPQIYVFGGELDSNGFKDDRLTLSSISVSDGLTNNFGQIYDAFATATNAFSIPLKPSYDQYWAWANNWDNYNAVPYSGPTIAIPAVGGVDPVLHAAWLAAKAPLQAAYDSALAAYNTALAADNTAASNLAPKLALLNTASANLDAAAAIYATKNAAKMAIVNGNPTSDVYATVMADSFNCASDARLKKDVVPLEGALDKIDSIRGVHYHWIDAAQPQERQVGVIAQEIQAAYPELVREGGNGFLSVDYPKLTAVLIQSIKELKAMVLELASK